MKYPRYPAYKDSGVEWIGEIPEDWTVTKLKFISLISADYGINISADNYIDKGVRFIRITDINEDGTLTPEGVFIREDLSKGKILERGDLLFARSGSVGTSFLFTLTDSQKYSFAGYLVRFRLKIGYSPSFVYLFSQSKLFKDQIKMNSIETTIENFNGDKYSNLSICLPNTKIQKYIVSRLNIIFNNINSLILKISKMIDLLKEKRQTIITNAVTKGLDPNVPMKDSGVEWIGEIPERWKVMKIKFTSYVKGRVGWKGLTSEEYLENGYAYLVTGQDFQSKTILWDSCYYVDKDRYDDDPYIQLKNGDLLITKDGTIGKLAIVDGLKKPACLNSGIFLVRPYNYYITDFLYYVLSSSVFSNFYFLRSFGSTIQHLYQNVFEEFSFPIPSIGEQEKIIAYLVKQTSKIDKIISVGKNMLQLLKEHKASLINQAVTGKIDVRGFSVPTNSNSSEA